MIIQCEQCQTKFRLDDSRVTEKGIKVRCARCKHVFSIARPQPVEDDSTSFWQEEPALATEAEQESIEPFEETAEVSEPAALQEDAAPEESALMDSFAFESEDEPAETAPAAPAGDDSDFSFPEVGTEAVDSSASTEAPDEMDFGAFDFGDDSGDAAEPAVADTALGFDDDLLKAAPPAPPAKDDFGGLDFSGDDMFGEAVTAKPEEDAADAISFDMGMDDFSDSMGVEKQDAGQPFKAQESPADTPFSLDDIDFGDELTSVAVQQVSTEELKPSQELLFAPMATGEAQPMFEKAVEVPTAAPTALLAETPPPVASRRKEGPRVSGMLVLLGVMIVALVVFYSVWGYMQLTADKGEVVKETGRISLRSVEASYIKNKKTGELLVISGEAVNEYSKPRAAVEVKGIIFGADGAELVSKSAFCGNTLTKEQLATMPLDKIEAAMANQFGDSLANMEVAPGDAIPFVIVIPKPAKGATDYGVEPVGSTVATDKAAEKAK